jgi:hypothetical protein
MEASAFLPFAHVWSLESARVLKSGYMGLSLVDLDFGFDGGMSNTTTTMNPAISIITLDGIFDNVMWP